MKKLIYWAVSGMVLCGVGVVVADRAVNGAVMDEGSTWCCESTTDWGEDMESAGGVSSAEWSTDTVWTVDTVKIAPKRSNSVNTVRKKK